VNWHYVRSAVVVTICRSVASSHHRVAVMSFSSLLGSGEILQIRSILTSPSVAALISFKVRFSRNDLKSHIPASGNWQPQIVLDN
jgi:hypothetical protein